MPKKTEKPAIKTAKTKPTVKKPATKPKVIKTAAKTAVKTVESKPAVQKPAAKPASVKTAPKSIYFYANGKRKTSVACVRLYKDGKGIVTVNGRSFENYFPVFTDQDKVISPLKVTNNVKTFDITIKVHGGGIHSQAEAVRHGIAKALLGFNAEYRSVVKPLGFLTRDSRVKERKKYGLKRARRAPQWQKR